MSRKILVVFGTRPEAIKMAPVVQELERRPEFQVQVAVTAQHRELLDQVLELFNLNPAYDLNIMAPNQSLSQITSRVLEGLDPILQKEQPDCVLVHGDTTTTFAAALAAFYRRIPIGHVEAGLRSGSLAFPFPEEGNRLLVSQIASWHFAPTEQARDNLLAQNVPQEHIVVTGNTVIDALSQAASWPQSQTVQKLLQKAEGKRILLLEVHRRESWGRPMEEICQAIARLVDQFHDLEVFCSVHPNPKVRGTVERVLGTKQQVKLLSPLPYDQWVQLMKNCYLIATDSGGMQEEAPSLGKPVVVLRDRTERPEGLAAGTLKLAGTEEEVVFRSIAELLSDQELYQRMASAPNPYGDGKASRRLADAMLYFWGEGARPADFAW
ncbi:MAG: UDP-N-acetylglucosamine 2-epimerase (non-hydrolyzing) [Firmicutes bacterium]|nr:UDP-N-acetylglucosamine 2-epimerase (non-hydrolyzing) [Bacillota bacterium]HQD39362.1 UDP-N-acetylglucosamine 2-epimerase (non-hydrolyzing) [Bacillota bacterium]